MTRSVKPGARMVVIVILILAMLLSAAMFLESEFLGGLAAVAIGLGAVYFGIETVRSREDQYVGSDSDFISTKRGLAAVLDGVGTIVLGCLAVVFGAAVAAGLVKLLVGWAQANSGLLLGLGGLWLALIGVVKLLGDEEARLSFDGYWITRQMDRVIGLPILVFGVLVVVACWTGYVPLIGWIR